MNSDSIYLDKKTVEDFTFNSSVSQVFDDMVSRSIPHYIDAQKLIADFVKNNINDNSNVYDLGCATGTSIVLLHQTVRDNKQLKYVGIDNSVFMLEKAKQKLNQHFESPDQFELIEADITKFDNFQKTGCVLLNLTLQFVRPIKRIDLITKLYDNMQFGGILALFEKVVDSNMQFNRDYINMYHDFKRQNHYSEIEISRKREELENVLIPYTEQENYEMLKLAGFEKISTIFKYLNFAVILAVK
ncbi:carboxy-S-adenosyl-L-methionine synthase CmoA [Paenibacillus terreus]|uniref:Carboxy-S-adenosyl-L-methionine synthase n=1 Tax=Paenibacillus terreus TaxID=1387834 RepID=A0ABV5BES9_9BACL